MRAELLTKPTTPHGWSHHVGALGDVSTATEAVWLEHIHTCDTYEALHLAHEDLSLLYHSF